MVLSAGNFPITSLLEMPGTSISDKDLVDQALQGNSSAFGELFSRHRDAVYRYSLRLLGDDDQAKDAVQEAFLRMHDNLKSLRDGTAIRFWLLGIARNYIFNAERRRSTISGDLRDVASAEPDPLELASQSEEIRRVETAIDKLSPEIRESIVLRIVEGLSYREIAELTGTTVNVVRIRIYRGRKNILSYFNSLDERVL